MKRHRYYTVFGNGVLTCIRKVQDIIDRNERLGIETRLFNLFQLEADEYAAIIEEVRK